MKMASNVKCGLCDDDFCKPKLLPCLHSYCEACLNDYIKHHLYSHQFACPACCVAVQLPEGGLRDFPDDFFHGGGKLCCSVHEKMTLKFYCRDCERVACSDCAIVRHKNHVIVDCHDDKLETEKREQIAMLEADLETIKNGLSARGSDIEVKISEINKQSNLSVDEINRRVKKMVAEVEKLGTEMKEKIDQVRKIQIDKLTKTKDENGMWTKSAQRGVTFSRKALLQATPHCVLSLAPCMKKLTEDLSNKKLTIPEIKHSYIYSPQLQINADLLKHEIGDLQILPERAFLVTFNVNDVTSGNVTWTANPHVIGCLPWYIGCMKTENMKLGIYVKLKEGEYKTLTICNASFSLKLVNQKNEPHSVTIQEDFPKTFLAGGVGGWEFVDWRRLTASSGFLDEKRNIKVRAAVRIHRLDTK